MSFVIDRALIESNDRSAEAGLHEYCNAYAETVFSNDPDMATWFSYDFRNTVTDTIDFGGLPQGIPDDCIESCIVGRALKRTLGSYELRHTYIPPDEVRL